MARTEPVRDDPEVTTAWSDNTTEVATSKSDTTEEVTISKSDTIEEVTSKSGVFHVPVVVQPKSDDDVITEYPIEVVEREVGLPLVESTELIE
eukprot:538547_1